MPPGPWSIPFLGVAHRIDKDAPHKTYTEWSKQHGDVISMTLFGTQKVMVVSSEAAIRDVMITKADYFSGNMFLITLLVTYLTHITRKQTLRSLPLSYPANPSLGMTPTIKYYSTAFIDHIL